VPLEIVPPGTHIDFIGKWKIAVSISIALIVISLVAIPIRGIRLGLDFAGGTEMLVQFHEGVDAQEGPIRRVLDQLGIPDPSVVRYGVEKQGDFLLRFREREKAGDKREVVDKIQQALAQQLGPVDVERADYVGPRVGAELRRDGLLAIGVACLLILIYIAFRFAATFAPGAVIALFHDVVITSGVFVLMGREFDLTVLAALLAILGYSLNDTIIVYDRIRENLALHTKVDLEEVLNRSVNQTLSRTLLTSGTTLLAVLALLVVGGPVIQPFALAMTIGIFVGTYSSVYIAAPTLLLLERRYGRRAHRGAAAKPAPQKPAPKSGRTARV
jgi:preprotein translocase subunit SecF